MFDAPLTIAHAIQLAVAPVFLLTAIGAMLGVFSNRLARIVDRVRTLAERRPRQGADRAERTELRLLARRARAVHGAIALATGAALFVSAVIAGIFFGFVMAMNVAGMVAALFVAATLIFMLSLLLFLWEVHLSTHCLRYDAGRLRPAPDAAFAPLQAVDHPPT